MPIGTPGFHGERLTQAREARGLTGVNLSELVGVSTATITQYERNNHKPPHDVLEKLSTHLNVPKSFFMRPVAYAGDPNLFWRSMSSATKAARTRAESRHEWLKEIVEYLNGYFDFPALNLPKVELPDDFREISHDFIEKIAIKCREFWNVNSAPLPNTVSLLEKNGILVSRGNLDADTLDAFSEFDDSGRAYIFLGADKQCCVRSRFDALHEAAHLILHAVLDRKNLNTTQDFKMIEDQAHYFANAIQLPEKDFTKELYSPTLDSFLALKERWKVSIGTMIFRCQHLGIITDNEATKLFINRTRRGWKRHEPLDDKLPVEKPEMLASCFHLLLQEGGVSKTEIIDALCLPPSDIEELAGLEAGFFSGQRAEIIPLPQFKRDNSKTIHQKGTAQIIPFRPLD